MPSPSEKHARTDTHARTEKHARRPVLLRSAGIGALAGVAGAAAMLPVERLEQAVTHRPDSFIPGRTLLALLGRDPGDHGPAGARPLPANMAMHFATGAALGALRGIWAATGVRGLRADLAHTAARLCTDQTLENATGVGAPPHTWPALEQVVDVGHKAVFALVTGRLADRWISPTLQSRRGTVSH